MHIWRNRYLVSYENMYCFKLGVLTDSGYKINTYDHYHFTPLCILSRRRKINYLNFNLCIFAKNGNINKQNKTIFFFLNIFHNTLAKFYIKIFVWKFYLFTPRYSDPLWWWTRICRLSMRSFSCIYPIIHK